MDEPVNIRALVNFIRIFNLEDNIALIDPVPLEDLRKLYAACDIFVLPSLFDFSPRVVAEAMASGKPVIATRVGALPTQVKDGYNGFLVDPANEKQLAHRIKYFIDNPTERDRMGKNARKYAEEWFDERRIAERYLFLTGSERA
jgi:glycosyltransferase involved in cell wall biosynthesis